MPKYRVIRYYMSSNSREIEAEDSQEAEYLVQDEDDWAEWPDDRWERSGEQYDETIVERVVD